MAYHTYDRAETHAQHRFGFSSLGLAGQRSLDAVFTWLERHRSRNELLRLDDHMLKDIGLSSADVENEAGKTFWQS